MFEVKNYVNRNPEKKTEFIPVAGQQSGYKEDSARMVVTVLEDNSTEAKAAYFLRIEDIVRQGPFPMKRGDTFNVSFLKEGYCYYGMPTFVPVNHIIPA